MDLYPRQRTFKPPSNVQDDYMPTPRQPQTNSALLQSLDSNDTSPVGGILSVAVFQTARRPALSEVEGDLGCTATRVTRKLHVVRNFRRDYDNYRLAATSNKQLPY